MSRRGRVWQEGRIAGAPAIRGAPWYFVVDIAPPGAPRRQIRRRGFTTQAAAQRGLDELLAKVRSSTWVEPMRLSLGEFVESWLEGLPASGRRPSTIASYGVALKPARVGDLAAVPLQLLTAADLDRTYGQLLRDGGKRKQGLSMRSVRYFHTVLGRALADAERQGLVARNVTRRASPPSTTAAKAPEFTAWTPGELRRFIEGADDHDLGALFRLAAMTGMRRGEVCGVQWDDIDLHTGRLVVRHTWLAVAAHQYEGTPKTHRGRRTIDVDPRTVAVLRRHRAAQRETRLLCGPGYVDRGFVFTRPDGTPLNPDSVSQAFERLLARLGLPRIRFHDLRHTHATHLLAAGVNPRVVSERLGHASVSFTLDVYGHVLPGQQAEAALAAARLVDS